MNIADLAIKVEQTRLANLLKQKLFESYDLQEAMSVGEALKVLKLTGEELGDEAKVKKAYHQAAMVAHPDRGGSEEMMKLVNDAYESLKGKSGSSGTWTSSVDREKNRQEMQRKVQIIKQYLAKEVRVDEFLAHLKKWDSTFEVVSKNIYPDDDNMHYPTFPNMKIVFQNADKTRRFYLAFDVNPSELVPALGGDTFTLPISAVTSVYVDGKQQKIKQSNYTFTSDAAAIIDPERLFPSARLNKIFSGEARKGSKFARRDMESALISELSAKIIDTNAYIPIGSGPDGDPFFMMIYRTVLMRQAAWTFAGVYRQKGISLRQAARSYSVTLSESYDTIKALRAIQDEAMKLDPSEKSQFVLKKTDEMHEKQREELKQYMSKKESLGEDDLDEARKKKEVVPAETLEAKIDAIRSCYASGIK